MYDVLDIADYIINYSIKQKKQSVSNLKLQKLLYFIQGMFLINSDSKEPCFSEKIEAWDFGPVITEAYREFKHNGALDIPYVERYLDSSKKGFVYKEYGYDNIVEDDKEMIDYVVDLLNNFSASDLVKITHKQTPWIEAYIPGTNMEITNKSIYDYFK